MIPPNQLLGALFLAGKLAAEVELYLSETFVKDHEILVYFRIKKENFEVIQQLSGVLINPASYQSPELLS